MATYNNRQNFEMGNWPELRQAFNQLKHVVNGEGTISNQLKAELFTMASLASGCAHCQSHGAGPSQCNGR